MTWWCPCDWIHRSGPGSSGHHGKTDYADLASGLVKFVCFGNVQLASLFIDCRLLI
jgi:hypothetical protein